jgi:hypothetical protein
MEKVLKIEDKEKERKACACCGRDDLSLMDCAACGTAKYCSGTCQKTAWPLHKATCKTIRKEKANEAARASGMKDMGSILNTLNMHALPKNAKYWEGDLYDACRFVRAILNSILRLFFSMISVVFILHFLRSAAQRCFPFFTFDVVVLLRCHRFLLSAALRYFTSWHSALPMGCDGLR